MAAQGTASTTNEPAATPSAESIGTEGGDTTSTATAAQAPTDTGGDQEADVSDSLSVFEQSAATGDEIETVGSPLDQMEDEPTATDKTTGDETGDETTAETATTTEKTPADERAAILADLKAAREGKPAPEAETNPKADTGATPSPKAAGDGALPLLDVAKFHETFAAEFTTEVADAVKPLVEQINSLTEKVNGYEKGRIEHAKQAQEVQKHALLDTAAAEIDGLADYIGIAAKGLTDKTRKNREDFFEVAKDIYELAQKRGQQVTEKEILRRAAVVLNIGNGKATPAASGKPKPSTSLKPTGTRPAARLGQEKHTPDEAFSVGSPLDSITAELESEFGSKR